MRFAWLLTRGEDAQAQDLVQSALTAMFERGFATVRHPKAFARQVMTNQHRDQARHRDVHERAAPRLARAEVVADVATQTVADRDALFEALGGLSARERSVVVLRYYEDHDDREIADILGCTRSTVRSLARRGLRRMRDVMETEDTGSDDG